jgi:nucleoside-diphosphate-sugar epimerase
MSEIRSYLVTGGAGFIGSHIVEELVKFRGVSVRALDNLSSGKIKNLIIAEEDFDFNFTKGDIKDYGTCLLATEGVDCVFHQAALRCVPKSFDEPDEYIDVNIKGTLNMLKACIANKVKVFVLASSSSVYGECKDFPQFESFKTSPISPYALSKLAGEHLCKMYSLNSELSTVCLRYFNVFGERQSLDNQYAVVIPKFITSIIKGERPPIYGTGKQARDFTYVKNVVRANILASEMKDSKGTIFNVAGGHPISILGLSHMVSSMLGSDIEPELFPSRAGDVFMTHADIGKIIERGFRAEYSFNQGLKRTIDYFSKEIENGHKK